MRKLLVAFLFAGLAVGSAVADSPDIVSPGSIVTLVATADGIPAPAFEWFKNGTKITDGATLTLSAVTANDSASYTVKATNIAGSATSDPYVIAVATPPTKPQIRVTSTKPSGVTVAVQPGTKVITAK